MFTPSYSQRGQSRSVNDAASYQQGRAAQLASIARTFLFDGNLREAARFQDMSASASAQARELLGIA